MISLTSKAITGTIIVLICVEKAYKMVVRWQLVVARVAILSQDAVSFAISIDEFSPGESISEGVCSGLVVQPPHPALTA